MSREGVEIATRPGAFRGRGWSAGVEAPAQDGRTPRGYEPDPSQSHDVERPGSPAAAAPHRPFGGRKGKRAAAVRCNR